MGGAVLENVALVGTWKLVSASNSPSSREQNEAPYGTNPVGFLTYTADGRVSVMISYGGRKPSGLGASIKEQAQAYKTFLATLAGTSSGMSGYPISSRFHRFKATWTKNSFESSNSMAVASNS